jgi:hypothetical protein
MIRFIRILGAGALAVVVSPVLAQEAADLERCANIPEATARLACYDELSDPQRPEPPAEVASPPPASPPPASPPEPEVVVEEALSAPEPMSRELGEEQLPMAQRNEAEFAGTVRRCEQNARGKWVFWFENGQVWEQRDRDRIRFDDCHFEVKITKDMFGYKMQRAGERRRIRIGRIK